MVISTLGVDRLAQLEAGCVAGFDLIKGDGVEQLGKLSGSKSSATQPMWFSRVILAMFSDGATATGSPAPMKSKKLSAWREGR